ncbi:hypothetical protein [Pontivivens nitratireducens]|uniref:Uncharacterized protein n=1 Tax=Pontivivens nitratireducens TaxID=2758038 RepID=A0A6G7VP04_9RHOB|nr:hypothetical protein [Pontibrevibacter nitratireducens]QIK41650.1 hypothetical protein G8E03_13360 [Pontibrevibacter nitratireducens]
MSNYTFARDMDKYYWNKFERVAEYFGHTNKDEFTLHLFIHAILKAEMWMNSDLYSKHERMINELEDKARRDWDQYIDEFQNSKGLCEDELPF